MRWLTQIKKHAATLSKRSGKTPGTVAHESGPFVLLGIPALIQPVKAHR